VFVSIVGPNGEARLPVPYKKAIVNLANRRVLGIVGQSYRLVTNREALDMADECCRTVFPQTKRGEWDVHAIDAPSTGGYCRLDLVHNSEALDFSVLSGADRPEMFRPYIRVTNSYNGRCALAFDIGYFRKICQNGMIVPDSIIRFKFNHQRREIGTILKFEISQGRLAKFKSSFGELLGGLRKCEVPRTSFDEFICGVLLLRKPEPLKPNSRDAEDWETLAVHLGSMGDRYAVELGENAYAVFNAITEFASRPLVNRCVHRERHSLQKLAGTWLGTFSRECSKPGFSLADYLEKLSNPETKPENQ
jgi:hypothetical protein